MYNVYKIILKVINSIKTKVFSTLFSLTKEINNDEA